MLVRIDLHSHSTASDGTEPPAEVVHRAREAGEGVMVGEREDVQAGLPGSAYHLGRRVRTIRGRAVAVQVDAHERSC